jgi:hypothetical protein
VHPPSPGDDQHWPALDRADKRTPQLPAFDPEAESLTNSLQRPITYAIDKLRRFEYVPLWYFTVQGRQAVDEDKAFSEEVWDVTKTSDNLLSLRTAASNRPNPKALSDEQLTWEQFMDIAGGKETLPLYQARQRRTRNDELKADHLINLAKISDKDKIFPQGSRCQALCHAPPNASPLPHQSSFSNCRCLAAIPHAWSAYEICAVICTVPRRCLAAILHAWLAYETCAVIRTVPRRCLAAILHAWLAYKTCVVIRTVPRRCLAAILHAWLAYETCAVIRSVPCRCLAAILHAWLAYDICAVIHTVSCRFPCLQCQCTCRRINMAYRLGSCPHAPLAAVRPPSQTLTCPNSISGFNPRHSSQP